MTDENTTGDPLMSPQKVEEEFGASVYTLAKWRSEDRGPAYVRVGRNIRYRRSAIEAWLNENTVTPANEGGR